MPGGGDRINRFDCLECQACATGGNGRYHEKAGYFTAENAVGASI